MASAYANVTDNPDLERQIREKTRHQQTDKLFALAFYNLPLVSRLRQLRTITNWKAALCFRYRNKNL